MYSQFPIGDAETLLLCQSPQKKMMILKNHSEKFCAAASSLPAQNWFNSFSSKGKQRQRLCVSVPSKIEVPLSEFMEIP